jgi:hypothetical protein
VWSARDAAGRGGFCIPVPSSTKAALASKLDVNQLSVLSAVDDFHAAAAKFAALICEPPLDAGSELRTTCAVFSMMGGVFATLNTHSTTHLPFHIRLNKTERAAGSFSSAVSAAGAACRLRPDTLVIVNQATLLIGEDKEALKLKDALEDVKAYVKGGINRHHYGSIPGMLAYAASGFELTFLLVRPDGQVRDHDAAS